MDAEDTRITTHSEAKRKQLVVPPSLCRFSHKPNLKNKFKLAGEEIDKVLNIWILLIHKEYTVFIRLTALGAY